MPALLTLKTKGKILVSEGENIKEGTVLSSEEFIPQIISINLAKILSVKPKSVHFYLTKSLGKEIKVSEVIAKKKRLFGLKEKLVKAPCNGILERLEVETGSLIISLPKEKKEIKSPVSGKIKKITNNLLTILTSGQEMKLTSVVGNFTLGELKIINLPEVLLTSLTTDFSNKIIAGKSWNRDTVEKAFALLPKAVIGVNITGFDLFSFDKRKSLLIGNKEQKLIFNFGLIKKEDWEILRKADQRKVLFCSSEKKLIIL